MRDKHNERTIRSKTHKAQGALTAASKNKKLRYCEEHSASSYLAGVLYDISLENIC